MTGQSQTNTQREDARNSVIETATQMFHAQGIRNVTMDDIAHKLSMSKRTLYQLFTDKEDLLLACVIKHEGDVRTHLAAIISQSANVLDFLLIIFKAKMKEFDEIVPSFFADLTKYPRIKEHIARNKQQQEDEAVSFLERGINRAFFAKASTFTSSRVSCRPQWRCAYKTDWLTNTRKARYFLTPFCPTYAGAPP